MPSMSSHGKAAISSASSPAALNTTKPSTHSTAAPAIAHFGASAVGTATKAASSTTGAHSAGRRRRRAFTGLDRGRGLVMVRVVVAAGRLEVVPGLVEHDAEDVGPHDREAVAGAVQRH